MEEVSLYWVLLIHETVLQPQAASSAEQALAASLAEQAWEAAKLAEQEWTAACLTLSLSLLEHPLQTVEPLPLAAPRSRIP